MTEHVNADAHKVEPRSLSRNDGASWHVWASMAGIALAICSATIADDDYGDKQAVATVAGQRIVDLQLIASLEGAGLSSDLTEEEVRKQVDEQLDLLIAESLLVQHAIDLGLPKRDKVVRRALTRSVVESLLAETPSPTEVEVHRYIADRGQHLQNQLHYRLSVDDERKDQADSSVDDVKTCPPTPLPTTALPLKAWRNLVGGDLVERLHRLEQGQSVHLNCHGERYRIVVDDVSRRSVPKSTLLKRASDELHQLARDAALAAQIERLTRRYEVEINRTAVDSLVRKQVLAGTNSQ